MQNRNESCNCGSGKKYKKCCLGKSEKIIPMTNRIRVAMKERQLDICKSYIENTSDRGEMYGFALKLADMLPQDIEKYKGLAEFDEMIEKGGDDAPEVLRVGGTGENLNDIVQKYVNGYRAIPGRPMAKEMAEMYQELLAEEQAR